MYRIMFIRIICYFEEEKSVSLDLSVLHSNNQTGQKQKLGVKRVDTF